MRGDVQQTYGQQRPALRKQHSLDQTKAAFPAARHQAGSHTYYLGSQPKRSVAEVMRKQSSLYSFLHKDKDPANISYMCMQMKQRMVDQTLLAKQKQKVKSLEQQINSYKKANHHVLVRRTFQHAAVIEKNRQGALLPDDDVNNGGYYTDFRLMSQN